MSRKSLYFVLTSFGLWRITLFVVAFLSIFVLPTFGGRFPYVDRVLEITGLPNWIWGFGNFDGVHYLRIAQDGYKAEFSQAFFPLFPLIIRLFSQVLPRIQGLDTIIYTDPAYFYSGLILANIFFFGALLMFHKLISLDFKEDVVKKSLILLLALPTAFYFGAVYTESLFLLLTVTAIYLIRKHKYFYSLILIALATSTRLIGLFLIPIYLIEVWKAKDWNKLLFAHLGFIGAAAYVYYLNSAFGDPFYFLTSQPVFGAERLTQGVVPLPQVIYRYINIFLTVPIYSFSFFNAFTELMFTLIPLALFLLFIKKLRFSYWVFSFFTLVLPTLTGTLSSMPRYALMSVVLMLPFLVIKLGKYYMLAVIVLGVLGWILLTMFIRGYWVA